MLGVVLAVVSIAANYVDRTALDTGQWQETTAKLLADEDIRQATADHLVDQLYENVDIAGELEHRLPDDFKGLSPVIAGGASEVAQRTAVELLGQPRVQAVFVRRLDGGAEAGPDAARRRARGPRLLDGAVALDLRPIVIDLAERVGVAEPRRAAPGRRRPYRPIRSDQLATAQDVTKALRLVADWLWVVFIGAWALAIWLHRGGRRIEVRAIASGLVIVGLALLALRAVAGSVIVDSLAAAESVRARRRRDLGDRDRCARQRRGDTVRAIGLVGLLGGLALEPGQLPSTFAAGLRRTCRRPEVAYGALLVARLLVVLWGPTVQSRELLTVAILAAIAAVGVEALRRQTAREFPDAEPPDLGDEIAALAARARDQLAELREPRQREAGSVAPVDELERLAALHVARGRSRTTSTWPRRRASSGADLLWR